MFFFENFAGSYQHIFGFPSSFDNAGRIVLVIIAEENSAVTISMPSASFSTSVSYHECEVFIDVLASMSHTKM